MEEYNEETIDLRDYLRVLSKRRWTVFSLFMLVVLTVSVHTFTTTPIYQATARIVIEKENPNLVSIQEVMAVDATGSDYYQTQYKIIESRAVARDVIRRLDLANSPEFFPPPKDDIVSNTKAWFEDSMSWWKEWVTTLLKTGPEKRNEQGEESDSKLVSNFINRVSIEPIRNSRLVDVRVEAMDPALAAKMANELVRTYIDQNLETKLTAAKDAVLWLSERIDDERKKVETAENALLRYKEKHGIITDFSSDAEQITAQKLAQLNQQVVEAEAQRVEAETRYRQALSVEKSPDMLDSIPEVLANDLVREIKKMEVNLYTRMSELSKKYGRQHPKMLAINSELKDLKKRKASEVKRVINSLRNNYKIALAREDTLKKALADQKQDSLTMNQKAVQYGVLRRQAESARNMYELLVKRFKETSLTEEMKTGNIRVVDRAEVPERPIKPKKKLNVLLAMVVGLTLGIGLAFFLEYMDNTIKMPEEVKNYLGVPYLGMVPAIDTKASQNGIPGDLVTLHSPKSTASEAFRGIRTGVLFSSADEAPKVLLVTSAGPAEGKTLCAANLAVTMANAGSKVALIDCDMRRPRLHKVFDVDRENGISSIMVGATDFKNCVVESGVENLDIIPCGPIPPNPSEILGSKKMVALTDALKKKYTRIVIDSPPLTAVTDPVILSQVVDGMILVIRVGETPRQVIQNGVAQVRSVQGQILGAVLNGVSARRDSYYYYQYYYYYYGEDGRKRKKAQRRKHSENNT